MNSLSSDSTWCSCGNSGNRNFSFSLHNPENYSTDKQKFLLFWSWKHRSQLWSQLWRKRCEKGTDRAIFFLQKQRDVLAVSWPLWKQNYLRVSFSLCLVQINHEVWGGRGENSSASAVGICGVTSLQHCRISPLLFPRRRPLGEVAQGKQASHISLHCGAKVKYFGGERAQIAHETSFHTPPDKAWVAVTDTSETGFGYFNFSLFPFIVPGSHPCCAGLGAHNMPTLIV